MVQIFYNNQDAFSGICPTPIIGQRNNFIKYGEQWGELTKISLYGNIVGGCVSGIINYLITDENSIRITESGDYRVDEFSYSGLDASSFQVLVSGQQALIQNFSQDFQSFQIVQDGQVLVNKPYALIKSISFPQGKYSYLIPFQIDIDCYESGFFSGTYGILEPKNEYSFTQNKDQSIAIRHTISCRGFNTDSRNSNALQNAKNYIASLSGYQGVMPAFVNVGLSGFTPSLISQIENINRVEGTYSVDETYIADPFFTSGVLRYATTYDSGIADGLSSVRVAGSIKTSKNYPYNFIRNRYLTFDAFSAAVWAYSGATNGMIDLNPFYLSSGVTEDNFGGAINFDISFNNDQTPNPFLDYSVSFDHDIITDITSATFQGTIKGRGDLYNRYQRVLAFSTGINTYNLTLGEYYNNGYQYILNPLFITSSNSKDPYRGEISIGATFNDKMLPVSGFASFDYSFKVTPSLTKYSAVPILNGSGNYWITNLGYANRTVVTMAGTAVILPNLSQQSGVTLLTNFVNIQIQPFINGKNRPCLESQEIVWGNDDIGKDLSFEVIYSYEDNPLII